MLIVDDSDFADAYTIKLLKKTSAIPFHEVSVKATASSNLETKKHAGIASTLKSSRKFAGNIVGLILSKKRKNTEATDAIANKHLKIGFFDDQGTAAT